MRPGLHLKLPVTLGLGLASATCRAWRGTLIARLRGASQAGRRRADSDAPLAELGVPPAEGRRGPPRSSCQWVLI